MQPPQTQYVERDGISIAYQVVGEGPVDLLISPGFISHLDLHWADPGISRCLTRLASFARLIIYDKAGTGLSDPIPQLPMLEERVADIEAVLDAAGSERAVLFGISEGGPTSVLMAAMRPQRIASLILYGTFACTPWVAPEDFSAEEFERAELIRDQLREGLKHWGDGITALELVAPSMTPTESQKRAFGMFMRASASPRMARALIETAEQIDVRDVLPSVRVPTLVLHADGDRLIPVEAGRRMADGITGARFVRFSSIDHNFWLVDGLVDEIERFVTGAVQHAEPNRGRPCLARAARASRRARRPHRPRARRAGRQAHRRRCAVCVRGPAIAMRCAEALRDSVSELGIQLRGGVHTGECEAIGEDLGGLAVHIGARVGALAGPGEIVVSSTVKELVVGSDMQFSDRGEHELKSVPGSWHLYALGEERAVQVELDGAAGYMRRSDRVAVTLARRMPRAMRLAGQLAARGASPA